MFSTSSPNVVAPLAQALTASNRLVALRSENLPLAIACESYNFDPTPNKVAYSHRLAVVSQEDFVGYNEAPNVVQEDNFVQQAELMAKGLQSITFTARNVIIPTINAYVQAYQARQASIMQPQMNLRVWQYAPVHNEPNLVNHIASRYATVRVQAEYRTFLLGPKAPEAIIELIATNNPHLDQTEATEWLLGVGADRISAVWDQLFNKTRAFNGGSLFFAQPHRLPQTVDELLIAYCLCGHFIDNPADDAGESVDLENWANTFKVLHEYFGSLLLFAYQRRVDDVKRDILIYRSEATDPLKTMAVSVEVNGDLYTGWLEKGGQVEALLGAAVYQSHLRAGSAISEMQEQLVARWNQLYPLMRQACQDRVSGKRRQDALSVVTSGSVETPDDLPALPLPELTARATAVIRGLKDSEFENAFSVFAALVCKVYYENPIYLEFLDAFETYSTLHPQASPRELALYGLIEVAASWMAQQQKVVEFAPQVDPDAVLPEPEVVVSTENDELAAAQSAEALTQAQVELIPEAAQDQVASPAAAEVAELGKRKGGFTIEERLNRLKARRAVPSLEDASGKGVTDLEINAAQEKLGLKFPESYKNYLKTKGGQVAGERKLTGLGVNGYQNVVDATVLNRKYINGHIGAWFLIEDLGPGINQVWCDTQGKLHQVTDQSQTSLDQTFDDYATAFETEAGSDNTDESFDDQANDGGDDAFAEAGDDAADAGFGGDDSFGGDAGFD